MAVRWGSTVVFFFWLVKWSVNNIVITYNKINNYFIWVPAGHLGKAQKEPSESTMYMYNVDGMEFLIFLLKLRNKLTETVQNSYILRDGTGMKFLIFK